MGILKHLLFWPVTGPKALVDFSVGQVEGVVRQELTDDTPVKEALLALQMELELGDIDEEEYARREAELMVRLRETRAWREELGMQEAWAPMSFADEQPIEPPSTEPDAGADPGETAEEPDDPWSKNSSDDSPPDSSSW